MAIIIDADVIIRGEKGDFDLAGWLTSQPDETFELAAVTVAELWHGVERAIGARRAVRSAYLQGVINSLPVIPYTKEIAYEHARLWAQLETLGKKIGDYDLIVAATALSRDCAVATFNARHFKMIHGLKVIQPGVD
jgi:predicted nucleic acid-binding protein